MPKMTDSEAAFVDAVAQMLTQAGLPRMAGRMWGYLLVCEPPEQSAADLAEALHASRGSISGTARLLTPTGLIQRVSRPGDRREYFTIPPGAMVAILQSRLPTTVAWRRLAERGLDLLADQPPQARTRLTELRDVYAFMERELPAMLERFLAEQAGRQADEASPASVGAMERTA